MYASQSIVHAEVPNITPIMSLACSPRSVPLIVTAVPPAVGPEAGSSSLQIADQDRSYEDYNNNVITKYVYMYVEW